MRRRTRVETAGLRALVHFWVIWLIAFVSRPTNFRGVQRLSWILTRFLPADDTVIVSVSGDTRVRVPLGDGYWTKLVNRHYEYEPEVAALLGRSLDSSMYFLDCGANIGYWSLLMRRRARGIVAVEANPVTFERLAANVALNGAEDEVTVLNVALWSSDGEPMTIMEAPRKHAGASVREKAGPSSDERATHSTVESQTLRTIIERHCPDTAARIVIKLDVEGAEIPALLGAGDLLRQRRALVVYEDHGSDLTCKVSRFVQEAGLVTTDLETGEHLTLEQIRARKTLSWKGYNFLAHHPD